MKYRVRPQQIDQILPDAAGAMTFHDRAHHGRRVRGEAVDHGQDGVSTPARRLGQIVAEQLLEAGPQGLELALEDLEIGLAPLTALERPGIAAAIEPESLVLVEPRQVGEAIRHQQGDFAPRLLHLAASIEIAQLDRGERVEIEQALGQRHALLAAVALDLARVLAELVTLDRAR